MVVVVALSKALGVAAEDTSTPMKHKSRAIGVALIITGTVIVALSTNLAFATGLGLMIAGICEVMEKK